MNTPAYLAILTSKRPIQYMNIIRRPFTIKHLPKLIQKVYNRKRPKASFIKYRMTTKGANSSTYSYQLANIFVSLHVPGMCHGQEHFHSFNIYLGVLSGEYSTVHLVSEEIKV